MHYDCPEYGPKICKVETKIDFTSLFVGKEVYRVAWTTCESHMLFWLVWNRLPNTFQAHVPKIVQRMFPVNRNLYGRRRMRQPFQTMNEEFYPFMMISKTTSRIYIIKAESIKPQKVVVQYQGARPIAQKKEL